MRPRPLTVVAVLTLALGSVVRALYALKWHRMMDHVYSDMELYWRFARYFVDPSHHPGIEDTLYPPGASLFFGYLSKIDAEMRVATYVQLAMALAVPLLVFAIGRELYERRVALLAMALASLYLPLFEYSGFLLAENPFTFFLLVAFYLVARSLRQSGRTIPFALAAGVCLGIAVAFKSAALMSALCVVVVVLGRMRWGGLRAWRTLAAAGVGLALVLTPLTVRATHLNEGRFCLVANEASRGILLGHHGDVFMAKFTDHKRGYYYEFGYSTAKERHRTGVVEIAVGPWDNKEVVAEAWRWTKENPKASLALGFEHVFDLFISMPWPSGEDPLLKRWTFYTQRGYQPILLFPAGVALAIIAWPRR
jgi:4-amino-4-deoxy-L-arabinose transferase-like glycosyltransferase